MADSTIDLTNGTMKNRLRSAAESLLVFLCQSPETDLAISDIVVVVERMEDVVRGLAPSNPEQTRCLQSNCVCQGPLPKFVVGASLALRSTKKADPYFCHICCLWYKNSTRHKTVHIKRGDLERTFPCPVGWPVNISEVRSSHVTPRLVGESRRIDEHDEPTTAGNEADDALGAPVINVSIQPVLSSQRCDIGLGVLEFGNDGDLESATPLGSESHLTDAHEMGAFCDVEFDQQDGGDVPQLISDTESLDSPLIGECLDITPEPQDEIANSDDVGSLGNAGDRIAIQDLLVFQSQTPSGTYPVCRTGRRILWRGSVLEERVWKGFPAATYERAKARSDDKDLAFASEAVFCLERDLPTVQDWDRFDRNEKCTFARPAIIDNKSGWVCGFSAIINIMRVQSARLFPLLKRDEEDLTGTIMCRVLASLLRLEDAGFAHTLLFCAQLHLHRLDDRQFPLHDLCWQDVFAVVCKSVFEDCSVFTSIAMLGAVCVDHCETALQTGIRWEQAQPVTTLTPVEQLTLELDGSCNEIIIPPNWVIARDGGCLQGACEQGIRAQCQLGSCLSGNRGSPSLVKIIHKIKELAHCLLVYDIPAEFNRVTPVEFASRFETESGLSYGLIGICFLQSGEGIGHCGHYMFLELDNPRTGQCTLLDSRIVLQRATILQILQGTHKKFPGVNISHLIYGSISPDGDTDHVMRYHWPPSPARKRRNGNNQTSGNTSKKSSSRAGKLPEWMEKYGAVLRACQANKTAAPLQHVPIEFLDVRLTDTSSEETHSR